MTDERTAFEAWLKREYDFLCLDRLDRPGERNIPGHYVFPNVQTAWESWKSSSSRVSALIRTIEGLMRQSGSQQQLSAAIVSAANHDPVVEHYLFDALGTTPYDDGCGCDDEEGGGV